MAIVRYLHPIQILNDCIDMFMYDYEEEEDISIVSLRINVRENEEIIVSDQNKSQTKTFFSDLVAQDTIK